MNSLQNIKNFILSVVFAGFSVFLMFMLPGPIIAITTGSIWSYEIIMALLCSILCMVIALKTAGPTLIRAILFFIIGASAAWFLIMGIGTFWTPIYYGLLPFIMACIGGGIGGWLIFRKLNLPKKEIVIWFSVPLFTALLALSYPFFNPVAGFPLNASYQGHKFNVGFITASQGEGAENRYLWIRESISQKLFGSSEHVDLLNVEFDPGSGVGRVSITKVTDTNALEVARAAESEMIKKEMTSTMGGWLTIFSSLYSSFDRGVIWRIDENTAA